MDVGVYFDLHDPVQPAEEAAVVDLVSGGRLDLDLGLGVGYRPPEFDLFRANLTTRYSTTVEAVRRVLELLAGLPVPGVFIFASVAGMPEKMVMEHVTTICTRLRPLPRDL